MQYNSFCKTLKELRISCGLNQVQLAEKLSVTKQTVSNWENDNIAPSVEMLIKIANYFNVRVDYLLGREENEVINVSGLSAEQKAHINLIINDLKKK